MTVTRIEAVTKTKFKVYLEDEFAFVLYKGELSRYQIEEGSELSQKTVEDIKNEVILHRAKLRSMHLLNAMDRTEEQLRTKLRQSLYPEDIIEKALQYVKSFGYVEDRGYAERFIDNRRTRKSKREIYASLCQKGVAREQIEEAIEKCYCEEDEENAIRKILDKKHFSPEESTDAEKKRIFDYLIRKGFCMDKVRQVIQVSSKNA